MKKTIWTLNINDFAPEICKITYPFLKHYASKIGAEFRVISERRWPDYPPVYEKLQIFELGRENDWNIYIDSDTLVHPDMYDVTDHLPRDTVCHNGKDMAGNRWRYDQYFRRDGRNIGACNWFAIASDWCLDLWHPLEDLTLEQARENIFPTVKEHNSGQIDPGHLIDDYTLSRNIARYGLKFMTVIELNKKLGFVQVGENGREVIPGFLWHQYALPEPQKLIELKKALLAWNLA